MTISSGNESMALSSAIIVCTLALYHTVIIFDVLFQCIRIFPTRDGSRYNHYAQPLQKHEIRVSTYMYFVYE